MAKENLPINNYKYKPKPIVSGISIVDPKITKRKLWFRAGLIVILIGIVMGGSVYAWNKNHKQPSVSVKPTVSGLDTGNPSSVAPLYNNSYIKPAASPKPTPTPLPNEFHFNLPVLNYHYIRVVDQKADPLGYALSVTPDSFRQEMDFLVANGYKTATPEDLYMALQTKKPLPAKSVILTFDDGYADFYSVAFPILKELNLKATLYVITGFVGDKAGRYVTWDQIREMDQSGLVTIGSHSINHVDLATSSNAKNEIFVSKSVLEAQIGHPVTTFCYPSGEYSDETANLVSQAGYHTAFTTRVGSTMYPSQRVILPRQRVPGGLAINLYPGKLGISSTGVIYPPLPSPSPVATTTPTPEPTPSPTPSETPTPVVSSTPEVSPSPIVSASPSPSPTP